jgi:tetratricopeptide (TPR) repeat protein
MTRLPAGTVESNAASIPSRPSPRILRIENHDETLPLWRESAGAGRILVHVDAHHDMWWVPPGQRVTIANFISPALQEGILRETYWVVPDRSWESVENRRQILHHLRRIQEEFPIRPAHLEIARDHISTTLLGKPLHICSVEGLPEFSESVLLDLDVDYLIFPRVAYGPGDPHPEVPWRWPGDLVQSLDARGVQSDLVTIAYSVEGGYTPLRWKYLGDELEARLDAHGSGEVVRGMDLMRQAAEAAANGDRIAAEQKYLEAVPLLPHLAAPLWHLAFLYQDRGRIDEGRTLYRAALDLDSTYGTAHNNEGLWHYWGERWAASEREYRRMLALDPRDALAHLGLGWLAMEKSRWSEAESELQRAADIDPDLLDAHRALGRVFRKMGRLREAIAAYEKSLKLSLSGRVSLRSSPIISAERPQWNDLSHFVVFLRLGQLYRAVGEPERAAKFLRMAAAGGMDGAGLRLQLASLAFSQEKWREGFGEIGQAFKQAAVWAGRIGKKVLRGVRKPFLLAYEFWQVR